MSLSIITVNLNNRDGLLATLESIMPALVACDVEWILIDGLSSDGSISCVKSALKKGNNKINVSILSEQDGGIFDAMNKGVAKAKKKYMLFLNSGDTLRFCKKLSKFINLLHSQNTSAYFFGFEYQNKVRSVKPVFSLVWKMLTSHQAMIVNRSIFENKGYNLKFPNCADYDLMWRIIKLGNYIVVDDILCVNELYGQTSFKAAEVRREYRQICALNAGPFVAWIIFFIKFCYERAVLRL